MEDLANMDVTKESFVTTTTTTTMSTKDEEIIWYNANEEYDSWHEVPETMDNYQEWDDLPIILEDTNKNNESPDDHIEPYFYIGGMSNLNTGCLKPIISPFITGYHFLHYMFNKLMCSFILCYFVHLRLVLSQGIISYIYLKQCSRQSPLHLPLCPTGSTNHASATQRNNTKPKILCKQKFVV